MHKSKGLLSHIFTNKKKGAHLNRSQEIANLNPMQSFNNIDPKLSRTRPIQTMNKTQDFKHHPSNKRQSLSKHNYSHQLKLKTQNNSFTSSFSTDKLFFQLSNQQNHNTSQIHQVHPSQIRTTSMTSAHSNNGSTNTSLHRRSKPKCTALNSQEKKPHNVSYYQFKKSILAETNNKNEQHRKRPSNLNHSMQTNTFEEEFFEKVSSATTIPLIEKLTAIENQMDNDLLAIKKQNDEKLLTNAKSYNVYKHAFESVMNELPNDFVDIIQRILNGYHQTISIFVSEQKQLIENYEELQKSKYSLMINVYLELASNTQELLKYKALLNHYNLDKAKEKEKIGLKTVEMKIQQKQIIAEKTRVSINVNKRNGLSNYQCFMNNRTSSTPAITYTKKHASDHQQNEQGINSGSGINNSLYRKSTSKSNSNSNSKHNEYKTKQCDQLLSDNSNIPFIIPLLPIEDLDELYFSNKIKTRSRSPINIISNIPKLPFDMLGNSS